MNIFDCYLLAGNIASEVRENVKKKYHVGSTLLQICESVENEIISKGAAPAFPVNVSLNDTAAHYTAEPDDTLTVKDNDIVKIDIGVHVQGYIADTAVTICYDPRYEALAQTAETALSEAAKISKLNTKASDIGKLIENIIYRYGFKPIQNLSGHSLAQYTIHAGKSIPNVRSIGSSFTLSPNEAYAIEPFVTTKEGQGVVYEGNVRNIFSIVSRKPNKDKEVDEFLDYVWNRFKTLPFALRWLMDKYEEKKVRSLTEISIKKRNVHAYPILVEGNRKIVAQAEHTIIPSDTFSNVITR